MTQSHSELFGLKGQDESGLASKLGKSQSVSNGPGVIGSDPKEGQGILGGAGHPTGAASGGPDARDPRQNNVGQAEQTKVGGMNTGSSDHSLPGSGGSLTPSQGTGEVRNH